MIEKVWTPPHWPPISKQNMGLPRPKLFQTRKLL
jgi:hypothetical protein